MTSLPNAPFFFVIQPSFNIFHLAQRCLIEFADSIRPNEEKQGKKKYLSNEKKQSKVVVVVTVVDFICLFPPPPIIFSLLGANCLLVTEEEN